MDKPTLQTEKWQVAVDIAECFEKIGDDLFAASELLRDITGSRNPTAAAEPSELAVKAMKACLTRLTAIAAEMAVVKQSLAAVRLETVAKPDGPDETARQRMTKPSEN